MNNGVGKQSSTVAARFEEIRNDEIGHRGAFWIALAKLES